VFAIIRQQDMSTVHHGAGARPNAVSSLRVTRFVCLERRSVVGLKRTRETCWLALSGFDWLGKLRNVFE
jgi:hypothetical protein